MKINDVVSGVQEKVKEAFSAKNSNAEEEKQLQELAAVPAVSEDEKKDRIKMMRHRGFQIASRNDTNIYVVLNAEKLQLREDMEAATVAHAARYEGFLERLKRKRKLLEEDLQQIKDREIKNEKDLQEQQERKKQLQAEIEALKQELVQIRKELSDAKRTMGERLVTDSEKELDKVVALQRKIYNEVKQLNEDRFKNTQPARTELVVKWKVLRGTYQGHFDMLADKVKLLGGEGINTTVANVLICLGSALAGVAGYFFAIFSVKAKFSSQDVFYFLLQSILEATKNDKIDLATKISFFMGALVLITMVSWWADRQRSKQNHFIDDSSSDLFQQNFKTGFNLGNTSYSYATKDKSWFLLWLRVLPLLLVVGTLIIMLSASNNIETSTGNLSNSTEGLLIGTALAMGMAAAMFVYIVKIVESRPAAVGIAGHVKRNWELAVALSVLIVSVTVFIFFTENQAQAFAVIGFLGACLGTAFSFAYGLRFWGLCHAMEQTEEQLDQIDVAIARNSVPVQPELDLNLNKYFEELGDGLYQYLRNKNHAAVTRDKERRMTLTKVLPARGSDQQQITNIHVLGDKKKDFEDAALFEMMEWEYEYFPEQAERLKVLAGIYRDKKDGLLQCENNIGRIKQEIEQKRPVLREEVNKVRREMEKADVLEERAEQQILQYEEAQKEQWRKDVFYLEDGFELGLWYRRHGEGPAHFPYLLAEKN